MATPTNDPFKNPTQHPHTYVVQNINEEEVHRLDVQDRMFTRLMGGVLPEQPDSTRFQSVLDVACGPGVWLIELAKTYPAISRLVGVDIGMKNIEYARAQAEAAGVSNRVKFQTMDALRMLDFPDKYFDLVNLRFGVSWLKKWDWPKIIREFQRVSKRGGIVRITEASMWKINLPATARLVELATQALFQAGHFFTPGPNGIIDHFAGQMEKYGIMGIQTKVHIIEFHKDPQALQAVVEDLRLACRTVAPFIKKWVKFPDDYDELYKQMVEETQQPDFEVSITLLTAWGEALKPAQDHVRRSGPTS